MIKVHIYTSKSDKFLNCFRGSFNIGIGAREGSYSLVHEAYHSIMGGPYAVKEVKLRQGLSSAKIEALKVKMDGMLELSHKNINRMFGYAIEQNNLTIVQEFVKLGTVYSK